MLVRTVFVEDLWLGRRAVALQGVASECKCDLILLSVDREYELGG